MIFLKKYIAALAAILLLAFYLILAWLLHRVGYQHTESFFLAEKAKLLFQCKDNTLLTLGTTFPSLVYLSTVVFSVFGYPFAPIISSAVFTTVLFYVVMQDFSKSTIQQRVYFPAICLLFVLHPGLVYTGVSGRGIALVLLFFYLAMRSLFNYYKTQTTFALSMASIYLTCLVFCNYQFIWLLLALFPFMVLVSLDGVKQASKYGSPIVKFYEAVNNRSQRRKLINRTIAVYLVLFLLPIVSVFLYKILNQIHAGNGTYFLTSQYASWNITGTEAIGDIYFNKMQNLNLKAQSQIMFQGYLLLMTPLLILTFFIYKGKLYELLTLIAPFIFVAILLLENQNYITIEYYLIFLVLGFIGITMFSGRKYETSKVNGAFWLACIATIFTGVFYFKKSSDKEEKAFTAALRKTSNPTQEKVITEEKRVASYISSLVDERVNIGTKILMDDAAAYPIIAHLRNLDRVILPANKEFVTLSENPKIGAQFICVAKGKNPLQGFTVLNQFNLDKFATSTVIKPTIMFETDNWAVYKLNNHFE